MLYQPYCSNVEDGLGALPEGPTLYAPRRTFGRLLIAVGKDPAYVMAHIGHTNPAMTLGLCTNVTNAARADRDRLKGLVDGGYLAVPGSGAAGIGAGTRAGEEAAASKSVD